LFIDTHLEKEEIFVIIKMQSASMKHTNLAQIHRTGVGNIRVAAAKRRNWKVGPLLLSLQKI
jgi:hypothetical protein